MRINCPLMGLLVQKFGGTSVGDPDRIRAVADHIAWCRRNGDQVVVVVSAMGKETDDLLRMAAAVASDPPGREMDVLITAGERKAMSLLSMALHEQGVPAQSFTGSQAGILTDTDHTNAKILEITPERIQAALDSGAVAVVGGAQGVSTDRNITFLGRGGSDTTAVALASALDADVCELYTDVSGVYTADPRIVPRASKMSHVSFDDLMEMTATGCPKPAMRSVEFALRHHVPLHIRSAFTWEQGTWVTEEETSMEKAIVTAVTHDTSEAKITVSGVPDQPGIAAQVFRRLASGNVNVDMIVQNSSANGVTDISFTVPKGELNQSLALTEEVSSELSATGVSEDNDIARVSLVGSGMRSNPGVAALMFETLADAGVNIEMISTSPIRTSCVVRAVDIERAVKLLHTAFDLDQPVG